jgi:hypothetical protein
MSLYSNAAMMTSHHYYENESRKPFVNLDSQRSTQLEDDLAVDVLMNMVHVNDIPDLQKLALACLQTRLSLLAMKQDSMYQKSGSRLMNLIAPEEKMIRNISITDLNGILNMASPTPANKKRKAFSFMDDLHEEDEKRSRSSSFDDEPSFYRPPDQNSRRRHAAIVYDFLTMGSRVRILKTGQHGTVVGEKNGGWRIIEFLSANGTKLYGTYRPSDMTPVEQ